MRVSKSEVIEVAREVRRETPQASEDAHWPDCYTVSKNIVERLEADFPSVSATVKEFIPTGGFRHYAVRLTDETGDAVILDASFDQFATDTDTPVNLADRDEIEEVIWVEPDYTYILMKQQ